VADKAEFVLYLKDNERCAFGLGWESNRRGDPLSSNPFPAGDWKHQSFHEGWEQFKPFTGL